MTFSVSTFQGHSVVRADGELDVSTAPQLRQTITSALDDAGDKVIVDLSAVTFMDSTTLGVLIGAHNRVRESGGFLGLVCPDDKIRRVFRITGLDNVFTLYDTVPDAATALA
ncbi:STAS domain-containing protein [Dactylosporangium siamense]|uniref:Anti-sigma factor antagonist n=1 Tax=Dactylosporangium siamense TaxID=685454 RepID=A0A919PC67_9ACTN|nr:STAS domain-containing protein [Dactylosporangium siamense]GIG42061.1 anti-sigma-B factor antagonist [Dactylosporangium siamense]